MKHAGILLLVLILISFVWNVSDAEKAEDNGINHEGKHLLKRKLFTPRIWQGPGAQPLRTAERLTTFMQISQGSKDKKKKMKKGKKQPKRKSGGKGKKVKKRKQI